MSKLFKADDGRGYSSAGMDRVRERTNFCYEEDAEDDYQCDRDPVGDEQDDDEYESE